MADPEQKRPIESLAHALNPLHGLRVVGRLVRPATKKPGSAPGTLVHTGPRKVETVRIRTMDYDAGSFREEEPAEVRDTFRLRDTDTVSWINVDGLHDVELIREVGEHFGLHPLVQEDIVHVGQRPKAEEYDDCVYLVLHMLGYDEATRSVQDEQISLVLGDGYVLSFQERAGDVFEPVRERLRSGKGRLRTRGADYLAYALMDAVVDGYYSVLERIGDRMEELDMEVVEDPDESTLQRVHAVKREMLVVRRSVWPLRDMLSQLLRMENSRIGEETKVFLRDVYDHAVQVLDTVETLRDLSSGLTDLYVSSVGQRTNEVMKVLTVMASIFIPLTFIAGVYGMNFEHMPELSVPWAYQALLGVMLVLALGMLWFFRRKGWL